MKAMRALILISSTSMLLWGCSENEMNDSGSDEKTSTDQVEAEAAPESILPENELVDFKFHIFTANIPAPLEAFEV